jgi:hypothetical protein
MSRRFSLLLVVVCLTAAPAFAAGKAAERPGIWDAVAGFLTRIVGADVKSPVTDPNGLSAAPRQQPNPAAERYEHRAAARVRAAR